MKKILIVEDVELNVDLLTKLLEDQYALTVANDGARGVEMAAEVNPDLILMDMSLPVMDGYEATRRIKANDAVRHIPIIGLSAHAMPGDAEKALKAGCDDYMTKPFGVRELLARIHAVLRRRPTLEAPGAPSKEAQTVSFGPFEFDLSLRRLSKEGQQISLTTGEFSMLKALVRHPRQPLSRDKLAQLARGREFEPFDRSLDVQISRLRKMLEPDPAQPRYIQTVWGVGYVFVPDGAHN